MDRLNDLRILTTALPHPRPYYDTVWEGIFVVIVRAGVLDAGSGPLDALNESWCSCWSGIIVAIPTIVAIASCKAALLGVLSI